MQPSKSKKRVLRSKDVAHILDLSPDDVIDLARRRRLPASKEGRFWRFSPAEVLKYKAQQTRGAIGQ